jgi:hypothetical protein
LIPLGYGSRGKGGMSGVFKGIKCREWKKWPIVELNDGVHVGPSFGSLKSMQLV